MDDTAPSMKTSQRPDIAPGEASKVSPIAAAGAILANVTTATEAIREFGATKDPLVRSLFEQAEALLQAVMSPTTDAAVGEAVEFVSLVETIALRIQAPSAPDAAHAKAESPPEIAELERQLAETRDALEEARKGKALWEKSASDLAIENKTLGDQLKRAPKAGSATQRQFDDLVIKLKKAEENFGHLKKSRDQLAVELNKTKDSAAAAEREQKRRVVALQLKIDELMTEKTTIELAASSAVGTAAAAEAKAAEFETLAAHLTAERENLKAAHAADHTASEELLTHAALEIQTAQQENLALQAALTGARAEAATLREELAAAKAFNPKKLVADAIRHVAEAQSDFLEVLTSLAGTPKATPSTTAPEADLAALTARVKTYRAWLADAENRLAAGAERLERITRQRRDHEELVEIYADSSQAAAHHAELETLLTAEKAWATYTELLSALSKAVQDDHWVLANYVEALTGVERPPSKSILHGALPELPTPPEIPNLSTGTLPPPAIEPTDPDTDEAAGLATEQPRAASEPAPQHVATSGIPQLEQLAAKHGLSLATLVVVTSIHALPAHTRKGSGAARLVSAMQKCGIMQRLGWGTNEEQAILARRFAASDEEMRAFHDYVHFVDKFKLFRAAHLESGLPWRVGDVLTPEELDIFITSFPKKPEGGE